MKILSILATCLFVLVTATTLYAVPASPDEIEIEQPDRSVFKARIYGDEFQSWIEAVRSGHTVVKNEGNNFWEYAEKLTDGTLKASGIRVDPTGRNAPSYLPKGVRPKKDAESSEKQNQSVQEIYEQIFVPAPSSADYTQGAGAGATAATAATAASPGDWAPTPVAGNKKMLLILVNFSNRTLVTTASNWYNTVFNAAPGVKSVVNYFNDNSFGELRVLPAAHSQPGSPVGVVTVTVSDAHPNSGNEYIYDTETLILNHALAQAANYVDFNSFDTNNNWALERSELTIYFIYAGYDTSGSAKTPNIWGHWDGGGVSAADKLVPQWAISGELNDAGVQHPMGIVAHELGHVLCGLPDLYDTSKSNAGLGNFSLMASGNWGRDSDEQHGGTTPVALDAWSRQYLGWTSPQVSPSGSILLESSLSSANNAVKLINSSGFTTEYWLAENRYPSSWDLGLRGLLLNPGWSGGLLITHVDVTVGTQGANDINKYVSGGHQGVIAEQASTATCNMMVGERNACRGDATTLYYNGNNDTFNDTSTPNSKYYNGTSSGLWLSNISSPGPTMTMSVSPRVLTLAVTTIGSGSVTSTPSGINCGATCGAHFTTGTSVTLQAVPDPNSTFGGWSGGGCSGTGTCTVTISDDVSVTAFFYLLQPVSDFSAAPTTGSVPLAVAFADQSQFASTWEWTFGDGSTSFLQNPTYTYTTPGTYSVRLLVRNAEGWSHQVTKDNLIYVAPLVQIPRIPPAYFPTLQAACDAAQDREKIQSQSLVFTEDLVAHQPISIFLDGGYSNDFSTATGLTVIKGTVVIRNGTIIPDKVVVRPITDPPESPESPLDPTDYPPPMPDVPLEEGI